jgi:hypothetical protein
MRVSFFLSDLRFLPIANVEAESCVSSENRIALAGHGADSEYRPDQASVPLAVCNTIDALRYE